MEQGAYEAGRKEEYSVQDDIWWNGIEPMKRAMETKTPLAVVWTQLTQCPGHSTNRIPQALGSIPIRFRGKQSV